MTTITSKRDSEARLLQLEVGPRNIEEKNNVIKDKHTSWTRLEGKWQPKTRPHGAGAANKREPYDFYEYFTKFDDFFHLILSMCNFKFNFVVHYSAFPCSISNLKRNDLSALEGAACWNSCGPLKSTTMANRSSRGSCDLRRHVTRGATSHVLTDLTMSMAW